MSTPYSHVDTNRINRYKMQRWIYAIIAMIFGIIVGYGLKTYSITAPLAGCSDGTCFTNVANGYTALKHDALADAVDHIRNYDTLIHRLGLIVNQPGNVGTDLSYYYYIPKNELLKMFCDQCKLEAGQMYKTDGIVVQFGVDGDISNPSGCKLKPYVLPASIQNGVLKFMSREYYYCDMGCPENCGGQQDTTSVQ